MRIVALFGDGIGPEISNATVQVLGILGKKPGPSISFETHVIGLSCHARNGSTFPDGSLEAARAVDSVIVGPVPHSDYPARDSGEINGSAQLRRVFEGSL